MFKMLKDKEFLSRFFKVSFPVMLHALILFIVNLVDMVMVSNIEGQSGAASAVYAVNQATYIFMIASAGVLIGAGVFIQQFNGAKDDKSLRQAFCYKIIIMLIFLIIFVTIYYLFGHHLVYYYCHNEKNYLQIYSLGKDYLYLIILSFIPYCLSMIYSTTVREVGETKYALIAGSAAVFTNIILNAIFIYVFKLGVVGAAIGTIISRFIELFIIVIICHKKKFSFCDKLFTDFKVEKQLAIEITKKGLVFLANELFWVVGMTLLSLSYAQRKDNDILDALAIVSTISNIFTIIFQGLSVGIGVMVGSYLGEGKYTEAKDYAKKVYWLGFLISIICGILIILFSPIIPLVFSNINPEQKAVATRMLVVYGLLIWGCCLYCCCYVTLKTGGEAVTTFLIDSGLMWAVAVPLAWCLVIFTKIDLVYIYAIITGFDAIKFVISYIFVKKEKWLNNLTLSTK